MPDGPVPRRSWRPLAVALCAAALVLAAGAVWWRWPRRPPVADGTAVAVSPHPDDETYAFGQTLAAQARAGHRVVGVLVTDGEESGYVATWTAEAGRDFDGDGDVDKWDFGLARREEYRAAMALVGATGDDLVFLGRASSHGATGFADKRVDAGALSAVLEPIAKGDGARGLFTVVGYEGGGPLARIGGDAREHPDHGATQRAVLSVARSAGIDAWFLKVYLPYQTPWKRLARAYYRGDAEEVEIKREMAHRYSVGASSTPVLWRDAVGGGGEYLGESYRP